MINRELRVAFSKKAQPVWFRITKWVVFLGVSVVLFGTTFFWYWVIGLPLVGMITHLIYRWKTRTWTQPWGGWNDIEAGHK